MGATKSSGSGVPGGTVPPPMLPSRSRITLTSISLERCFSWSATLTPTSSLSKM